MFCNRLGWLATAAAGLLVGSAAAATLCVKPGGADGCHPTIQGAIDAASAGDVIEVHPGSYLEVATGRTVLEGSPVANGPHQFGLFISQDRDGLTIQGVDAKGKAVKDWRRAVAFVTTDATNNFGYAGIFVEGDGVSIRGLNIGPNVSGENKTIEIIGDAFTLADSDVSALYGSIYFDDWRFDETNDLSHVRSYTVTGNNFGTGVSIDLTSGAGYTGDVSGRVISRNRFAQEEFWPSISFNGSDTGVPWFVYSVGGAVIKGNEFTNTFQYDPSDPEWNDVFLRTAAHIRARGTYDNAQFDWDSYFRVNRYNHAFATGPNPPGDLRGYTYPGGYGTYQNVRRIGVILEGEQDIAEPGDTTIGR